MLAIWALACSGCSGLRLHDEADLALAKSARQSFEQAGLGSALDDERASSQALLRAELAAARSDGEARRDRALAEILDSPEGFVTLRHAIDDRSRELVGGDQEALATFVRKARAAQDAAESLQRGAENFRKVAPSLLPEGAAVPALACPLPEGLERPAPLAALISLYERDCSEARVADESARRAAPGGEIAGLYTAIDELLAEQQRREGEVAALRRDFEAAVRSYEKAFEPGAIQTTALVSSAVMHALGEQLDRMDKCGEHGHLAALEERYKRVTQLVDAAATGQRSRDSKSVPWTVAEIVVSRVVDVESIRSGAALPVLLMEAERLRIAIEAERRAEQRRKAKLALRLRERDATITEARALVAAADALGSLDAASKPLPASPARSPAAPAGKPRCATSARIDEVFSRGDADCRELVALALIHYANAWNAGRIPAENARWLGRGVLHEEAIDASATALALWESMLRVPLDEVVHYHETGIPPAQLAQILVTALGLGAVTIGVAVPAATGGSP
jgi:hypothetical protein